LLEQNRIFFLTDKPRLHKWVNNYTYPSTPDDKNNEVTTESMSSLGEIFSEVRTQRLSQSIETQLKKAIFQNHLKPGDRIPSERELSELFNVSRLSVREALRSLERSGFLIIKKGVLGGAFVIKSGPKASINSLEDLLHSEQVSLDEIGEVRLVIEPPLAALAAQKANSTDIRRLREANQKLEEGYRTGDPAIENDPAIHSIIADISGNRVFSILMNVLVDIHSRRMQTIKLDAKTKASIVRQHDSIITAIEKKKKELAQRRMKEHISKTQKALCESESRVFQKKKPKADPHSQLIVRSSKQERRRS
jgi:GntR family transcriptional regulator, transcriptional repressor for pyruvate dehydrogenase complex